MSETIDIGDHDVLFGRGSGSNYNKGNISFRKIAFDKRRRYLRAKKKGKNAIAQEIVDEVHGKGGRFLDKDTLGNWTEVDNSQAVEKSMVCLRQSINHKKKEFRDEKSGMLILERQEASDDGNTNSTENLAVQATTTTTTLHGKGRKTTRDDNVSVFISSTLLETIIASLKIAKLPNLGSEVDAFIEEGESALASEESGGVPPLTAEKTAEDGVDVSISSTLLKTIIAALKIAMLSNLDSEVDAFIKAGEATLASEETGALTTEDNSISSEI